MDINLSDITGDSGELAHAPPDFITHLNYVQCLNDFSKKLVIKSNLNIKSRIKENEKLDKKLNLIRLTKKSIDVEFKTIKKNSDFAEACVPWIAVKSYYLLFNLLLIVKHLLFGDDNAFNSKHREILDDLKNYIKRKEIIFNKEIFNYICPCKDALLIKSKSGLNLRRTKVDLQQRCDQIIKKLALYKLEDFQREKNIPNFRKKKNKEAKNDFIGKSNINICEFFYWYRIKSNYRDLKFLDQDISDNQFVNFYQNYFELTENFYNAFTNFINSLSKIRLKKEII